MNAEYEYRVGASHRTRRTSALAALAAGRDLAFRDLLCFNSYVCAREHFGRHQSDLAGLFPEADDATIWDIHLMVRKAGHVVEYSILAILLSQATLAIAQTRRGWFAISLALIAAVAISDEFHQTFVPGRNGSPADDARRFGRGRDAVGHRLVAADGNARF